MVRLSAGLLTPLFKYTEAYGVWGGHISSRNINRPGWAYVSEGCCKTIGEAEIFPIQLDSRDLVERFGVHPATDHNGYPQGAQAVPNRDGTQVIFASSWDGLSTSQSLPVLVVEKLL